MKIKYIGKTSKLTMINGKVYEARQGQKGWFALIDETGEEYAYPPQLFEVVEDDKKSVRPSEPFHSADAFLRSRKKQFDKRRK